MLPWASVLSWLKGVSTLELQQRHLCAGGFPEGLGGSNQPQRQDSEALPPEGPSPGKAPLAVNLLKAKESVSPKHVLNREVGSILGLDWEGGWQGPVWDLKSREALITFQHLKGDKRKFTQRDCGKGCLQDAKVYCEALNGEIVRGPGSPPPVAGQWALKGWWV